VSGTGSAAKLLARLRDTKAGWTPGDLAQVLVGHGFTRKREARHGIFFEHPDFPAGTTVIIPRHTPCKTWVAVRVLKAVDLVLQDRGKTSSD
jgi:hypothetical protein